MGLDVCGHTHSESGRLPGVATLSLGTDALGGGGSIRPSEGLAGGLERAHVAESGLPELQGGHRSICHVISLCRLDVFYNKV